MISRDDLVVYRLMQAHLRVGHSFAELLRAHCVERRKPYVVTPVQWGLMVVLDSMQGQPIGALSEKMRIDAAALTGVIKRLEQSGLIERVHDRVDRRVVRISLSEKGQDIYRSLVPLVKTFNEQILPPEQRPAFFTQLETIAERAEALAPTERVPLELFGGRLRWLQQEE